jgi:hypothetical protein
MVAGVFARHGVFFGDTGPGDDDRRFNRKGYFEHPAIIARTESGDFADWPAAWWQTLLAEGYELGTPWGIKRGPMAWPWVKILKPALIVFCKRNARQVVRSRLRRWPDRLFPRRDLRLAAARLKLIGEEAEAPVVTIRTESVVAGDYRRIAGAFVRLGIGFDPKIADTWIDADLWNGGAGNA